jgi:hypothetical protein
VSIGVIALRVVLSDDQVEAAGPCGDCLAAFCASLHALGVRPVLRPVIIPATRVVEDVAQLEPVDTLRNRYAAELTGFGASRPGGTFPPSHSTSAMHARLDVMR